MASWSIIGVVHADSKKLSGVYGMSAEDTFDEDEIDWDTFDWEDMPAAEDTETNEANKDSVATLNHDPDHDDWDDDLEMDRSALLKAIIDKCEKDGHATSSTVDAEAVDEFVLATFGTTKVKRGLCHLMGEQLQQIREAFAADDKGSEARYAKLVAAIGWGTQGWRRVRGERTFYRYFAQRKFRLVLACAKAGSDWAGSRPS